MARYVSRFLAALVVLTPACGGDVEGSTAKSVTTPSDEQQPADANFVPTDPRITVPLCSGTGWKLDYPRLGPEDLNALTGTGPDDVYVANWSGQLFHFDGTSWKTIDVTFSDTTSHVGYHLWASEDHELYVPNDGDLYRVFDGQAEAVPLAGNSGINAVWGSSASNVYAVGWDHTIYHFDGDMWDLVDVSGLFPDGGSSSFIDDFFAVWGSSGSDVFAATDGAIVHFDGSKWARTDLGFWVREIWGSGENDVYAVGDNATIGHFDGSTWTTTELPDADGRSLGDVWGSGPNDIYVVQSRGNKYFHFDGMAWSTFEVDAFNQLTAVWGSYTNDVYLIGTSGAILHSDGTGFLQLNGTNRPYLVDGWLEENGNAMVVGVGRDIYSLENDELAVVEESPEDSSDGKVEAVWPLGGGDVLMATTYGSIYQYRAGTFEATKLIPDYSLSPHLRSLQGRSSSDVVAAGDLRRLFHYDGQTWQRLPTGAPLLRDVATLPEGYAWAVGVDGVVWEYRSGTWTEIRSPGSGFTLSGVWAVDANHVFAVGGHGEALVYDGATWSPITGEPRWDFKRVWASGPDSLYALGEETPLLHYEGEAWHTEALEGKYYSTWTGIWGRNRNDIYAIGGNCSSPDILDGPLCETGVLHFDGTSWTTLYSSDSDEDVRGFVLLLDVWGDGGSGIVVVGTKESDDGTAVGWLLHFDGTTWEERSFDSVSSLTAVFGTSASDIHAVGIARDDPDRSILFHDDGNGWSETGTSVEGRLNQGASISSSLALTVGDLGPIYGYDGSSWYSMNSQTHCENIRSIDYLDDGTLLGACYEGSVFRYDGESLDELHYEPLFAAHSLWANDPNNIFVVGEQGQILHFDGRVWDSTVVSPDVNLISVTGAGPNDVIAVSDRNDAFHYNGTRWSALDIGFDGSFNGIVGDGKGRYLIYGYGGLVIEYPCE